jgi:hypothetical protein
MKVEIHKKIRSRYHPTLTNNFPFGKAARSISDSMEFLESHHEQLVGLIQSRNQEPRVEKRNSLSYQRETR